MSGVRGGQRVPSRCVWKKKPKPKNLFPHTSPPPPTTHTKIDKRRTQTTSPPTASSKANEHTKWDKYAPLQQRWIGDLVRAGPGPFSTNEAPPRPPFGAVLARGLRNLLLSYGGIAVQLPPQHVSRAERSAGANDICNHGLNLWAYAGRISQKG
jgi:hypothetical protein